MDVKAGELSTRVFEVHEGNFSEVCLEVFSFQYKNNSIYKQYCDLLKRVPGSVNEINQIPFLPISLFKQFKITTTGFEPDVIFESSGTTGMDTSRHYVKDVSLYEESFLRTFKTFYGNPEDHCILGLLPSYLEKGNSSLVYMVNRLCELSKNKESGFYLYNYSDLGETLKRNIVKHQKTILIGVTYALLDFAEKFPMDLSNVIVMETGGMKGRKKEILRESVHEILKKQWNLPAVHSEYGMTELLSQAYSLANGVFQPPAWMKILCRQEDDPLSVSPPGETASGAANIIDLANLFSCSFLATDDLAKIQSNGKFQVEGRSDHSDLRGCSLLFTNT